LLAEPDSIKQIKLADFGLAKILSNITTTSTPYAQSFRSLLRIVHQQLQMRDPWICGARSVDDDGIRQGGGFVVHRCNHLHSVRGICLVTPHLMAT
jgi:hypothetical protein